MKCCASLSSLLSTTDPRIATRSVGLASVFSTILLAEGIHAVLPVGAEVVVDVGGGEAPYASRARGGLHVVVDRHCPGLTLSQHRVVGDACQLPIGSGVADLVLCTEVVEHVPDDRALYEELRRIIHNDGVLILTAPFVHSLHESPHDYRRPTSAGLLYGLTRVGFDVCRMSAVGGTGDVVRDAGIRSLGQTVRALARRVPLPVALTMERSFVTFQTVLADRAWRKAGERLHEIDPLQPVPRLSLGYVVLAKPT